LITVDGQKTAAAMPHLWNGAMAGELRLAVGDSLGPYILSRPDRGALFATILARSGVTAVAPGVHDLSRGPDLLAEQLRSAGLTLLLGNLHGPQPAGRSALATQDRDRPMLVTALLGQAVYRQLPSSIRAKWTWISPLDALLRITAERTDLERKGQLLVIAQGLTLDELYTLSTLPEPVWVVSDAIHPGQTVSMGSVTIAPLTGGKDLHPWHPLRWDGSTLAPHNGVTDDGGEIPELRAEIMARWHTLKEKNLPLLGVPEGAKEGDLRRAVAIQALKSGKGDVVLIDDDFFRPVDPSMWQHPWGGELVQRYLSRPTAMRGKTLTGQHLIDTLARIEADGWHGAAVGIDEERLKVGGIVIDPEMPYLLLFPDASPHAGRIDPEGNAALILDPTTHHPQQLDAVVLDALIDPKRGWPPPPAEGEWRLGINELTVDLSRLDIHANQSYADRSDPWLAGEGGQTVSGYADVSLTHMLPAYFWRQRLTSRYARQTLYTGTVQELSDDWRYANRVEQQGEGFRPYGDFALIGEWTPGTPTLPSPRQYATDTVLGIVLKQEGLSFEAGALLRRQWGGATDSTSRGVHLQAEGLYEQNGQRWGGLVLIDHTWEQGVWIDNGRWQIETFGPIVGNLGLTSRIEGHWLKMAGRPQTASDIRTLIGLTYRDLQRFW